MPDRADRIDPDRMRMMTAPTAAGRTQVQQMPDRYGVVERARRKAETELQQMLKEAAQHRRTKNVATAKAAPKKRPRRSE